MTHTLTQGTTMAITFITVGKDEVARAYTDRAVLVASGTVAGLTRRYPEAPVFEIRDEEPQAMHVARANAEVRAWNAGRVG